MGMKELFARAFPKDEEFAQLQKEDQMQTKLSERKKSSNERELERFMEEQRQKEIKESLTHFRNKQKEDMMKTTALSNNDNMFKEDKQHSILKSNDMFKLKKVPMGKGVFFK